MSDVRVGLYILCHQRPEELRTALLSAADDDWAEVLVLDSASDPPVAPVDGVRWIRSEENAGVAKGRNMLAQAASADLLVFLDDDAVFLTPCVQKIREMFSKNPDLAALAFRVERAGGVVLRHEQPFSGRRPIPTTTVNCGYFIGCAYAIRRSTVLELGGYDEGFFYSNEEIDLSLRLLSAGFSLSYVPQVRVEHRPSYRGRAEGFANTASVLKNRIIVARKHLPVPFLFTTMLAWAVLTLRSAIQLRAVSEWATAVRLGLTTPVTRSPIKMRAAVHLQRLGGRIIW